jgi:hypothetical protein
VRQNPGWFAGVMLRRAGAMLRYNDSLRQGWPADTSQAPIIELEPMFGHKMIPFVKMDAVWSNRASELLAAGASLSPQAVCTLSDDGQRFMVEGNGSSFDNQFASAPIAVEPNSDYVLRLPALLLRGQMAAKVMSVELRQALASEIISAPNAPAWKDDDEDDPQTDAPPADTPDAPMPDILMPFASGARQAVRIVISNNSAGSPRPAAAIGQAHLYQFGPTPQRWTRIVRPPVRAIQRNLYTTSRLPLLTALGFLLLALARRWQAMLILLIVPLYYLSVQSAFHTEYRYVLPIHYFLFAAAAVTFEIIGVGAAQMIRGLLHKAGAAIGK